MARRRSGRPLAVAVGLVVLVAGCAGSGSAGGRPSTGSSPASSASLSSPSVTPAPSWTYRPVEFGTRDGQSRSGRLFGEGTVAVILSHMGRPGDSQDDWAPFAQELADRGYTALTYDRRPTGEVWRDVLGAADYLHDHGADTVIAAGASLGAMASLSAAERPDSNLNGVIWLAGILQNRGYHFRAADVSTIGCPMLFTSGDHDVYGAADAARRLHQWATAPSDLAIVHSQLHGTDIIADGGASARKLTRTMLTFIDHVAHQPTSTC